MPGAASGGRRARAVPLRPWRGGADPLAPPFDVRAASTRSGATSWPGGSLREPCATCCGGGSDGRRGLDELAERGPPAARGERAAATSAAPSTRCGRCSTRRWRRSASPRRPRTATTHASPRCRSTLPDDVAGAVRALTDYEWHSTRGQGDLRPDRADAPARGPRRAVRRDEAGPVRQRPRGDAARSRTCWPTSTPCSRRTPAARTRPTGSREFMDKHGDLFPGEPRERRRAHRRPGPAAGRGRADDGARCPASSVRSSPAHGRGPRRHGTSPRRWRSWPTTCAALRPGLDRRSPVDMRRRRSARLGRRRRSRRRARRPRGAAGPAGPGLPSAPPSTTSTSSGWSSSSAPAPAPTSRRCASSSASWSDRASSTRGDDGLRLTPKALRRLGETALRRVFEQLDAGGRGDHDDRAAGSGRRADRPRPGVGVRRRAAARRGAHGPERASCAGGSAPGSAPRRRGAPRGVSRLEVEDFEVAETERRARAAVALCVDLSFSMMQEGRWGPMKQTALALSHLVQTRFRHDALQIIGFDRGAPARRCSWPRSSRSGCRAPTCSTR